MPSLRDGLVAFVKRDCPTCRDVEPVLAELVDHAVRSGTRLTVFTQDDAEFMAGLGGQCSEVLHDHDLAMSWHHEIDTVPTLMAVMDGREMARTVGWDRRSWEALSGADDLGAELPDMRPGCGSMSVDPLLADELALRFGATSFASRKVELASAEDPVEAAYDRGWSDGLPVVPPTEARVAAMLAGTTRAPGEVVAVVPPALVECTVEKVAVNAVMAGCKPEYLPVVLAAVEAACTDTFNMHGLLCTLWFSGPIVIGQAAEFDYAGTQACKALREEGVRSILVNSNPATIMTDEGIADRVYIEPITRDVLARVIERERPQGLLASMGGQTGLNMAVELAEAGILQAAGVRILGTPLEGIQDAEDRERFRTLMRRIGEPVPESRTVTSLPEAWDFARSCGFPLVVRPAYTLGGSPLACSAAVAVLDLIEVEGLVRNAEEMDRYLRDKLNERRAEHQLIGDVRGEGLLIGVEWVKDHRTREPAETDAYRLAYRCFELGLLLLAFGNVMEITPPLTIPRSDADEALDIFDRALADIAAGRFDDSKLPDFLGH